MTKMLYFIIIVAFLDTFIQLPIITPYALELGASYTLAGAIVAVYSFTNIVGNILGGHWIDRFGRKKMLFNGMLLVGFILLLYPLAQTGEQLFVVRMVHGLAGGVLIPAAFAFIGDRTSEATRGKTMALTGACIGIAAIIGPAIGGIMAARSSITVVFILVAILFLITAVIMLKFIKESFYSTDRGKFTFTEFVPLLKHPLILQASLAAFALMVSNGTLAFALPLNVSEMSLTSETTGILLSVFGIVALIVFLSPLNRIYDRFSPVLLVIIGILLIGIALLILSVFVNFTSNLLAMVVYGFGFALVFPSMNRIVADASTKVDRGKAYGIFYAFFSLGVVAGSFISGLVAQLIGRPFLISALLMIIITAFIGSIKQKRVFGK
ncbi:MFS transporter [Virgibacillus sp. W0430]|uniref:MFS transporter n=1 Tax=Virgibacillus sp. W0430 TaxID=3391580 RepID=UPI003F4485ED